MYEVNINNTVFIIFIFAGDSNWCRQKDYLPSVQPPLPRPRKNHKKRALPT